MNLDNRIMVYVVNGKAGFMATSVSLATYIDDWMNTYKAVSVRQSTYDRLLTSIKALGGYAIAQMPISEITSIDIQKYVNELAHSGYGLSTIKKQMRIVTAPLKQASALHLIPANPAVGICLPVRSNVCKAVESAEPYSPEEQAALKTVLSTNKRHGYATIALMLETGLRVGEALALRWRDINIVRKRLYVRATVVRLANKKRSFVQETAKSEASNRTVPLTPCAVSLLQSLAEGAENEYVFVNDDGERLSYEALRYQTQCACKEAGIPYRGQHVFRHTFATNCYYKGVDIKILSKLLGHADTNITYNIYVNLYGDGFDEMYKALTK